MKDRLVWLAPLAFVLIILACTSGPTTPAPAPQSGGITEVPSNLPPLTALESAVKLAYEREFGEKVFRPAIYNDPRAVGCNGQEHLTATAYLRISANTSQLLFMYLSRDGMTLIRKDSQTVVTPAGNFRVLTVFLTYPQTTDADTLGLWQAAQQQFNADLAAFAQSHGLAAPIAAFTNATAMLPGSEVADPRSLAGIVSALRQHGIEDGGYDLIMSINIDPSKSEGGFAWTLVPFVYVGNVSSWQTVLSSSDLLSIVHAAYYHEVAHIWGWPGTHDWAPSCGGINLGIETLIAPPILFGWEDVDGDGVPEILDQTPYGRSH